MHALFWGICDLPFRSAVTSATAMPYIPTFSPSFYFSILHLSTAFISLLNMNTSLRTPNVGTLMFFLQLDSAIHFLSQTYVILWGGYGIRLRSLLCGR